MGKTMQKLGGQARTCQIAQWQTTVWTINLHKDEFVPKSRKRKAENVFVQSQVKKIALLKEEVKSYEEKLKVANKQIKSARETNKRLSRKSGNMHNKSWSEYSAQYKRKQKKQVATDICAALTFTENTSYSPSRIELVNNETNELLIVKPDGSTINQKPCQNNSETLAKQTLYVKERYNVSNTAYHELSMIHPSIPCLSKLNKLAKKWIIQAHYVPLQGLLKECNSHSGNVLQ